MAVPIRPGLPPRSSGRRARPTATIRLQVTAGHPQVPRGQGPVAGAGGGGGGVAPGGAIGGGGGGATGSTASL